jgi:hypothetical protein
MSLRARPTHPRGVSGCRCQTDQSVRPRGWWCPTRSSPAARHPSSRPPSTRPIPSTRLSGVLLPAGATRLSGVLPAGATSVASEAEQSAHAAWVYNYHYYSCHSNIDTCYCQMASAASRDRLRTLGHTSSACRCSLDVSRGVGVDHTDWYNQPQRWLPSVFLLEYRTTVYVQVYRRCCLT